MFDYENRDDHGECREEIRRLEHELRDLAAENRSLQAELQDAENRPCDCGGY